ncbi:FARSB [Cordylochernes scorpioides]|uniref:Phenylalanine--tRNA ligase beta subunit n=1 Tax=Cordylochernes scorpioides TaxID=51811 RepID=A0ABY6KV00_9ARAC|nr:FARSB [Cordylochernes scorpioides]
MLGPWIRYASRNPSPRLSGGTTRTRRWSENGNPSVSVSRITSCGSPSCKPMAVFSRLYVSRTDENVQKITDLIKENPRTTLLELEQDTGISKTTIGRIVTEDLKLKKTPAKFIPRFLNNEQKLCRLATCEDRLEMTRTNAEWKDKIITGDETNGYDRETKRQSAEWRGQGLKKEYTVEEFNDLCFEFGIELDEVATNEENGEIETIYKIEVPANRLDLLCIEGLVQALLVFTNQKEMPRYRAVKSKHQLIVKPSTSLVRPYAVAAILRGLYFNKSIYKSHIDLQDKLSQNIGRMRKFVSIGTHDLDKIQGPFIYDALKPSDITFKPLNQSKEFTATELMKLYSGESHLKPYLAIIQDKPVYPIMADANGTVLSFPPIVNGDHSKISLDTKNMLIEITGTDIYKVSVVLDTMVTMFSSYCKKPYTVEQVEVVMPDGTSKNYPELPYKKMTVNIDYINNRIGIEKDSKGMIELLKRMTLNAEPGKEERTLEVEIPPTRHDIIHPCDISEDAAIAYGFNNIGCEMPIIPTLAEELPISRLADKLRDEMVACTFTEGLSFVLCSRDDIAEKLRNNKNLEEAIHIANPKTQEFQVARTTLLPGLLKTLQSNRRMPLPIKIFEVTDVVLKDETTDTGARNQRNLAAVWCGKQHGLERLHGTLDHLLKVLGVSTSEYQLNSADNEIFLEGQCAEIVVRGVRIGRFGVVHPEVLNAFDLTLPCSALEINVEVFV